MSVNTVQQEADRLYKSHYGIVVSSLLTQFKAVNLETIEDIVQDSFAAALTTWTKDNIPSNPAGWLYIVCRNKVINKIKEGKKIRFLFDYEDFNAPEPEFRESAFDDQQLALLFACAHPDLSPKVQVVITLKYVANLKVEAIAKALGMTIDGIDKLLSRARKKIREENILLVEPGWPHFANRLPIVNKIIYLIFNEGYKSSSGEEMLKEELCEEALLINKALLDKRMGDTATAALQALMLFNAARFKGRFGPAGELLDLEEQDRNLWNQSLISLAREYLEQSRGAIISTYHYEASIAFLHCTAKSFQSTNWSLISDLYWRLLEMNPNPFVELNYAIALYYSGQKNKALGILHTLQENPFLNEYYLLNATLGKFCMLEGRHAKAREFFLRTLDQTSLRIEKDFIRKMMKKL
jgi:RNA polymerase sigma factor (sigma-70 family)